MVLEITSAGRDDQQLNYVNSINAVIQIIAKQGTGKLLLGHVRNHHRVVRITPYTSADLREGGRDNARVIPLNPAGSGTLDSGEAAGGSGSEIHFSPETIRERTAQNAVQFRPDEVLVHELAHSVRQINGVERYQRVAGRNPVLRRMGGGWDTIEEFFAGMVASVYSSELGRDAIGNHGVMRLRNPGILRMRPYSTRMREFRRRMPAFCQQLAAIPNTPFNPFRDV